MSHIAPLNLLSAVVVLDSSLQGWSLLERPVDPIGVRRVFTHYIAFNRPFASPPVIQVALVGLDVSNEDNVRLRVAAQDITANGFSLRAETWWNTRIWSVEVSWLAIGS